MAFLEVEFPTSISYKAVGGPGFSTNVNQGFSGGEQRNRNWASPRREYTVSLLTPAGVVRQDFLDQLVTFFSVAGGKFNSFRLKDFTAYQATGQAVALNAAGNPQLAITRSLGGVPFTQFISKPITSGIVDYQGNPLADTVVLAADNTGVAVDPTTGLVQVGAGTLVNFSYHVPVRFDTDKLQLQMEESGPNDPIVSWSSIPLIEVLPPDF